MQKKLCLGLVLVWVLPIAELAINTDYTEYEETFIIQTRVASAKLLDLHKGEKVTYELYGLGAECYFYLLYYDDYDRWKGDAQVRETKWRAMALKHGLLNDYGESGEIDGSFTVPYSTTYAFTFVNRDWIDVVTVVYLIRVYPAPQQTPVVAPSDDSGGIGALAIGGLLLIVAGIWWWRRRSPTEETKAYGCPYCGNRISPYDRFCGRCGNRLKP